MNELPRWASCRLCRAADLVRVVDLGRQAISCRYPKPDNEPVPAAPLELLRCPACNLGQLSVSLPPEELYRTGYGYRSGQTLTMQAHLDELSNFRSWLQPDDVVLDIGSNDGTLLRAFPADVRRVGFDPIAGDHEYPGDIVKVCERFTSVRYQQLDLPPARLVTAIAMFYDLDDPAWFLEGIRRVLASDGLVVLEFMYLKAMLDGAWDQISHEHVCYHSLGTVAFAAAQAGLEVVTFSDQQINGGTLRVVLQHAGGPLTAAADAISDRIAAEKSWDWSTLPHHVACAKAAIQDMVRRTVDGAVVHVLGASQRGNVVLQAASPLFGVTAAVERDERKVGRFTPGTKIPIIHEGNGRPWATDYIVTPWQFKDEILRREKALGAPPGTRYLFPLPEPQEVVL